MAKKQGSVAALSKEVKTLKRQVSELRAMEAKEHAMGPARPEDLVARQAVARS